MSTRCQPPWRIKLKPSRIHRSLICVLAVISVLAIFSTQTHFRIEAACAIGVILAAICQYKRTADPIVLNHDPSQDLWQIEHARHGNTTGHLLYAGYRSACLVILVIQREDSQRQFYPVWQDQLKRRDFSYLHHQLLFNTSAPIRRNVNYFASYIKTAITCLSSSSHTR